MTSRAPGAWWLRKQCVPEEELAIEIGNIDGVHVNDINVAYAAKRQVLQQLTAKATCRGKAPYILFPYAPMLAWSVQTS